MVEEKKKGFQVGHIDTIGVLPDSRHTVLITTREGKKYGTT